MITKVNYLREHADEENTRFQVGDGGGGREPTSSSLASQVNYSAIFTSAFENMEMCLDLRGGLNIREVNKAELCERVRFWDSATTRASGSERVSR